MQASAAAVQAAVSTIVPFDDLEYEHLCDVRAWIESGAPLFRIRKPHDPPKHLVSYFVLFDVVRQSVMVIDHIKASLWLPTGGHVEPNEHPSQTVVREAQEELQIAADFTTPFGSQPLFVTVTETRNADVHTDVSLWYIIKGNTDDVLAFDRTEMRSYRWLTLDEVLAADVQEFDPHMHRFVHKMKQYLAEV